MRTNFDSERPSTDDVTDRRNKPRALFEIVAPRARRAPAPTTRPMGEHRRVDKSSADDQNLACHDMGRRSSEFVTARAIARRAQQAGTSARPGATAVAWAGSMPHRRVSRRSAAAASADPPPIPDATGKFLVR